MSGEIKLTPDQVEQKIRALVTASRKLQDSDFQIRFDEQNWQAVAKFVQSQLASSTGFQEVLTNLKNVNKQEVADFLINEITEVFCMAMTFLGVTGENLSLDVSKFPLSAQGHKSAEFSFTVGANDPTILLNQLDVQLVAKSAQQFLVAAELDTGMSKDDVAKMHHFWQELAKFKQRIFHELLHLWQYENHLEAILWLEEGKNQVLELAASPALQQLLPQEELVDGVALKFLTVYKTNLERFQRLAESWETLTPAERTKVLNRLATYFNPDQKKLLYNAQKEVAYVSINQLRQINAR